MTNRTEFLPSTLLASTATLLDRKVWSFPLSQPSHTPLPPPCFDWSVGIENCGIARVNPAKDGKRRLLDVYLQMQHYEHWKRDLQLAKDVGVNCIRYSLPWYKAEPQPRVYDWS